MIGEKAKRTVIISDMCKLYKIQILVFVNQVSLEHTMLTCLYIVNYKCFCPTGQSGVVVTVTERPHKA